MTRPRRPLLVAAQAAFAIAVVWFAVNALARDWTAVATAWHAVELRAGWIALAAVAVLVTYALLIELWRRVVLASGATLSFGTAARIWFVSNFARYVPGKVWQLAAMGTMSHNAGVPAAVAVGASLLVNVVNILAGVAVVLATASDVLPIPRPVSIALALIAASLALAPSVLPRFVRWAGARMGRTLALPAVGYSMILVTFAGCALTYVLFGVALQLVALGTVGGIGGVGGDTRYWIALFAGAYIAGYVSLLPGGLGVREAAVVAQMEQFGLATSADATVIALMSRVVLTILELLPGLIFLARAPKHPSPIRNDVHPT